MPTEGLQGLISVAIGLGLAAACGFRVFTPLLIAGIAAHWGHLPLAGGFEWLASVPAMIAFGTATILEIGAYYFPWLDHALDLVATPAAVLAGMLAAASVMTDLPPLLKWTATIIGGGGAAGLVQAASVLLRLKSTALTGGLGNPVVATGEAAGSVLTSIVSIMLPIVAVAAIGVMLIFLIRWRSRTGRRETGDVPRGMTK
jgi:hypothetical protein